MIGMTMVFSGETIGALETEGEKLIFDLMVRLLKTRLLHDKIHAQLSGRRVMST